MRGQQTRKLSAPGNRIISYYICHGSWRGWALGGGFAGPFLLGSPC